MILYLAKVCQNYLAALLSALNIQREIYYCRKLKTLFYYYYYFVIIISYNLARY